jgi:predicted metal-binding protein
MARGTNRPPNTTTIETIRRKAVSLGALHAKVISTKKVFTGSWVRWKCRYGCDGFGSNLLCPPHSPTPDETRRMLDEYRRAILIHCDAVSDVRPLIAKLERKAFLGGFYKAFGFACGPCELCPTCAFEEGCRHSDQARPAMEACGIDVFRTAREAGFPIEVVTSRSCRQNYYGLLLLE